MKCFINVFKADLKRFFICTWKFYLAFLIICILQALIFFANIIKMQSKKGVDMVSLGDSLTYFFRGAKVFNPKSNEAMDIPMLCIFLLVFFLFILAYYINTDVSALGKSIIVTSGSPVYWWISKYIITLLAALIYMIIIIASFVVSGIVIIREKFDMSLKFTSELNIRLLLESEQISIETDVVLLILLCFISIITAGVIMFFVTYVSNSIYGFIINLIILVFSICYMKSYAFFNFMMMYRIEHIYKDWYLGAVPMICIDVVLMIVGIVYSRKRDFL